MVKPADGDVRIDGPEGDLREKGGRVPVLSQPELDEVENHPA